MELLFSYGTLQKEKTQIELFGRILQGKGDKLKGYKVAAIEISDESFLSKGEKKDQLTAVLSENKNDFINGTAFELTEKELIAADKYEPDNYRRIKVKLASGKEAWVYIVKDSINS